MCSGGLGGLGAAAGGGVILASLNRCLMSDYDGIDHVTWNHSWQKINIVSKGNKAGLLRLFSIGVFNVKWLNIAPTS
jgi:hypothetical protein